jgi:hypothetical protein
MQRASPRAKALLIRDARGQLSRDWRNSGAMTVVYSKRLR